MDTKEIQSLIALQHIPGIGCITAKRLIECVGSAAELFEHSADLPDLIPNVQPSLIKALKCPHAHLRAEQELEFIHKHNIRCVSYHDEAYPSRLRECDDAPIILFYRGNATLNPQRAISIVGTRKCTEYGRDLCERLVRELAEKQPGTLIISGLAYGIDINAHRNAIKYGLPTVAILAHGLDRIYPYVHRNTAAQMTTCGGILTEYISHTEPERQNFLQRNRIIAGMADATVIVESAEKGGALVTANIANSYNRDCFTFPGRIDSLSSAGCHHLIRNNLATLITSADDLIESMMWDSKQNGNKPESIQRSLFLELSEEENLIVQLLNKHPEGLNINILTVETNIPINRLSALLFGLELQGVVRPIPGNCYRLIL